MNEKPASRLDCHPELVEGSPRARSAFRAMALLCLLAILLAACKSVPFGAGLYISKGRPFIIAESTQKYGWGVLSHPRLIALDSSNIVLRYYMGGESHPHLDGGRKLSGLSPAMSHDGGRTWSFGETNMDERIALATRYWGYDIATAQGVILADQGFSNSVCIKGGAVADGPWQGEWANTNMGRIWPLHRGGTLSDGTLIAVGHQWHVTPAGRSQLRTAFMTSADRGRTWNVESFIAGPADTPWGTQWGTGFEGPNEPCIVVLPGDELLSVARVGMKIRSRWDPPKEAQRMVLSRSRDGGKTWRHSCMNAEGVFPKMIRMSNGVLVLAFGRPGNNLLFSTDNGRTWGRELAITGADGRTTGYCDVLEVAPGRLLVVFDGYNTDLKGFWLWEPKEVNGLLGVYVDVKRIL